jgi:RNA polymerase sigma-70 factor (ECF subfamily)
MNDEQDQLAAARQGDEAAFRHLVGPYRRELRAYCYRMAGSLDDADDLLQESLVRAWRGLSSFEGRASFRTWLYRVAWSCCVDVLQSKPMRKLTVDHGPPAQPDDPIPAPDGSTWIGPCPASLYADGAPSPEARYSTRESVALAFLAALQLLPPKQRATLLACDVLGWSAPECAEMLGSTVASVTSSLQRARETIETRSDGWRPKVPAEAVTRELLAKYVQAWERADVPALVSLLHEEATLAMPPMAFWLLGPRAIGQSIGAMVLTPEARGRFVLVETEANGSPAFAAYARQQGGGFAPVALHVIAFADDRIAAMTAFLDPALFGKLDLPEAPLESHP